jgi:DNA-binding transcriptional LysR family regulator
MLTLHLLRAFVTLARHESYTLAGKELGVSQATLSAQIASLEQAAGLQLCEHVGGKVRLTSMAHSLLETAREMVRLADEASLAMAERAGAETISRTPVRIAADTTVGTYVLPAALGALHREFPQVQVFMDIGNRAAVEQWLAAGDTDLAVMGQPPALDDLEVEPYLHHELVAFASPIHPLAGLVWVPLAQFVAEPFAVRERGSGTRHAVERLCAEAGVSPRIALELGHNGAVKAAVGAGLGVGIISKVAIEREVRVGRLALLNVEGFPLPRRWHIVRRRARRLSAACNLVLSFLCNQRDGYGELAHPLRDETLPQRGGGG